ncbi:MAG: c-type cytochrome biogenesis protein CcmI, partial [Bradyrhizobium sp.]
IEGSEASIYKDQLAEVDRDRAAGLIAAPEAEAARVEISRRLLAAADQEHGRPAMQSNPRLRRSTAVLALVGLPVLSLAVYLPLGSPRLPDFPLAARNRPPEGQRIDSLVAQVEDHLAKDPTDGRGWSVLAPVLLRLGRFDDAVRAYRNSITYSGETAAARANLGVAIVAAAGGVVTDDAKAQFKRALALKADEPRASYFVGLAAEQDGRKADAASIWRAMLDKAPAKAPWRPLVQQALARVGGGLGPTLSAPTMRAAQNMTAANRDAMIHGMVARLAGQLKQNGNDVQGWLRLVRAYMVMGDRAKAKSALADAREAVAKDPERLKQLNEGLRNLGLDG